MLSLFDEMDVLDPQEPTCFCSNVLQPNRVNLPKLLNELIGDKWLALINYQSVTGGIYTDCSVKDSTLTLQKTLLLVCSILVYKVSVLIIFFLGHCVMLKTN